jgi:hypothetical protein
MSDKNTGNEGIILSGNGTINAEQMAVGRNATISGTVNKIISQLQTADAPEAPQLADLLKKLQAAIETDHTLKPEEKDEALEQIAKIAEAGKSPKEAEMQKLVKTANRTLKGMLIELPNATKFIEACGTLLPLISKVFGF